MAVVSNPPRKPPHSDKAKIEAAIKHSREAVRTAEGGQSVANAIGKVNDARRLGLRFVPLLAVLLVAGSVLGCATMREINSDWVGGGP
jgi:hypothetical protein